MKIVFLVDFENRFPIEVVETWLRSWTEMTNKVSSVGCCANELGRRVKCFWLYANVRGVSDHEELWL